MSFFASGVLPEPVPYCICELLRSVCMKAVVIFSAAMDYVPVPPHPCLSAKCLAYSVHGTFIATSHTIWFPPLADRIGGAKWCKKSICLIGTAGSARIGTSGEVKISPARHPSIALMRHNRRTARTAQRMNDPYPFCGTPRPDLQDHE